jgi:hypothetical protein
MLLTLPAALPGGVSIDRRTLNHHGPPMRMGGI